MPSAKRLILVLAVLASLVGFAGGAAAQEGRFSGIVQLDLTNAYYFRGILQEKDGFIAQPWGEAYFSLYGSDDGFIRDVTLGFGVWMSIHSEETLALNGPESVYETDYYPLVSVEFAGGVTLLTTYYFYDSPNGAWDKAVQELNFKLSWDDSETLGAFAVAPYLNLAIETYSTSLGSNSGTGLQFGIAPTFYENDHFSISGSAEIGLAIDDYYEGVDSTENTFGYATVGGGVGVPINDTFAANLGFKYFIFGDDLETVNGGHGGHGVVTASLSASF
jgi:hypothetical protein